MLNSNRKRVVNVDTRQLWAKLATYKGEHGLILVDVLYFHSFVQKSKQKSPGRATSRSRKQPLTPGEREKVTQINMCIANKQMHDKHKDQLPLPQAR